MRNLFSDDSVKFFSYAILGTPPDRVLGKEVVDAIQINLFVDSENSFSLFPCVRYTFCSGN